MKNVCRYGVLWALFMILVLSPVSSEAGFLVEFQNGRRVKVEGYRVEGKNYELFLESGSLRVSKEEIKSIQERKDDPVRISAGEAEKDKPEAAEGVKEQKPSKKSVPQEVTVESVIKKKAELRERLEEAKKVYFAATEKAEKEPARKWMTACARELFSLETEVKENHNGALPDWWKEN